ncbi:hypothetical protein CEXT_421971 [Caerostris extrusa]|uniref:Uncharacterized protein n=1 Tax=Caerostris extrusa TaxID=172846 RepID=A0AAV4XQX8_CAEEX|nr:hypothetical protein CEXT_421971 [Caerostris extrusa]
MTSNQSHYPLTWLISRRFNIAKDALQRGLPHSITIIPDFDIEFHQQRMTETRTPLPMLFKCSRRVFPTGTGFPDTLSWHTYSLSSYEKGELPSKASTMAKFLLCVSVAPNRLDICTFFLRFVCFFSPGKENPSSKGGRVFLCSSSSSTNNKEEEEFENSKRFSFFQLWS